MVLRRWDCILFLVMAGFAFVSVGCSDSFKARQLLSSGKYQEVVEQYPFSDEAKIAIEQLSQQLLVSGKYDEILENFSGTLACSTAYENRARELLQEEKYADVVIRFPNALCARTAKDTVGARLYRAKKYREILEIVPRSTFAEKVRVEHPDVQRKIDQERYESAAAQRLICQRLPNQCLRLGMEASEVRRILGEPSDINNTEFLVRGKQQKNSQWVYRIDNYNSYDVTYLYFENSVLTSWQY